MPKPLLVVIDNPTTGNMKVVRHILAAHGWDDLPPVATPDELPAELPRDVVAFGVTALRAVAGTAADGHTMGQRIVRDDGVTVHAVTHPGVLLSKIYDGKSGEALKDMIFEASTLVRPRLMHVDPSYLLLTTPRQVRQMMDTIREAGAHTVVSIDLETTSTKPHSGRILEMGVSIDQHRVWIVPENFLTDHTLLTDWLLFFRRDGYEFLGHNVKFERQWLRAYGFDVYFPWDTMLLSWVLDERPGRHSLKTLVQKWWENPTNYADELQDELKRLEKERTTGHRSNITGIKARLRAAQKAGTPRALRDNQLGQYVENIKTELAEAEAAPPAPVNFGDVPTDIRHPYLAKDVAYTFALWEVLRAQVENLPGGFGVYWRNLVPVQNFIGDIEKNGLWLDATKRDELEMLYTAELEDAAHELRELCGESFNPGSWKQVGHMLYEVRKYPSRFDRRKNKVTFPTNEATLKALQAANETPDPFIDHQLRWRKAHKLLRTYVNSAATVPDKQGYVHGSINIIGTVTGRPSGTQPNLLNIPRTRKGWPGIRDMWGAPEGYQLVIADYSQAELRVLAHLSRDPWMVEMYTTGQDIHSGVAAFLFGDDWESDDYENRRAVAKTMNFGGVYNLFDAGAIYGILTRAGLKFTRYEIEEYMAAYKERVAGLVKWQQAQVKQITRDAAVQNLFGNWRRFGALSRENAYQAAKEGINFLAQGPAAQLTWLAMLDVNYQVKQWRLDATPRLMVYDSMVFQVRSDQVEQVGFIMLNCMRDAAAKYITPDIPFDADVKAGKLWGQAHKFDIDEALMAELFPDEEDEDVEEVA